MSAVASIIFESHLHCTKDNLSGLFYSCDAREGEISCAKRRNYERFGRGGGREEVFWLWGKGEMWYDEGVRSFRDLDEGAFREGFGFFSGEGETCGSDLKM